MFPFVILAALVGGGAFWAFTRVRSPVPSTAPVSSAPTPALAPPAPSSPITPIPSPTPQVDTVAELAAQLEAQRKALEVEQRQAAIRGFIDRIAAVENLMKLDLVQLTTIERDDSRMNDYEQQERRTRGVEGSVQSLFAWYTNDANPAWGEVVAQCKAQVIKNCGLGDVFGICRTAEQPRCESKIPDAAWGNPAHAMQIRAQNDHAALTADARRAAETRLAAWKRNEALPLETRLAERETQYRGMVAELSRVYGVTYQPMDAQAQAAHARAKV